MITNTFKFGHYSAVISKDMRVIVFFIGDNMVAQAFSSPENIIAKAKLFIHWHTVPANATFSCSTVGEFAVA